jgi:hypothetical protein
MKRIGIWAVVVFMGTMSAKAYLHRTQTVRVPGHPIRLEVPEDWKLAKPADRKESLEVLRVKGVDGLKSITIIAAPRHEANVYDSAFVEEKTKATGQYSDEVLEQRHYAINGVPVFSVTSVKRDGPKEVFFQSCAFAANGFVYTVLATSHFGDVIRDWEIQEILRSITVESQSRSMGGKLLK